MDSNYKQLRSGKPLELSLRVGAPKILSMKTDPLYEEVPPNLRTLSESELATEEQLAHQALIDLAIKHMDQPNYEDAEILSAEKRLLEASLALNLRVREKTFETQMAKERRMGEVTPQVEEIMRSLVNRHFAKDIDRLYSQLLNCREKLSRLETQS